MGALEAWVQIPAWPWSSLVDLGPVILFQPNISLSVARRCLEKRWDIDRFLFLQQWPFMHGRQSSWSALGLFVHCNSQLELTERHRANINTGQATLCQGLCIFSPYVRQLIKDLSFHGKPFKWQTMACALPCKTLFVSNHISVGASDAIRYSLSTT